MKAKCFAVMLAVFALCGVASAQAYFIRADSRNNLRSCAGFNCRVVETVPVGTVLQVVGEFNRWLKISRNGAALWMANWINYTRVEAGDQAPTPSQPTSNVDNCCFVDRQCNSDAEWASGFWAFQNNQCAAPQLPSQTSSPPASMDSSQIDNCCFLDWLCTTDEQWWSGYQAFQANQCKHPGVAIEGSAGFIAQIEAPLDMLKHRAPQWYDYVVIGLNKIVQWEGNSGVDVGTRTFYLVYSDDPPVGYTVEEHTIVTAGIIVHDACHVHRNDAGFPYGTNAEIIREERACVEVQLEAVEAMDIYNKVLGEKQWLRETIENIENPEYWWW